MKLDGFYEFETLKTREGLLVSHDVFMRYFIYPQHIFSTVSQHSQLDSFSVLCIKLPPRIYSGTQYTVDCTINDS